MRRRFMLLAATLTVALVAAVLVLPAAARGMMGYHAGNQAATGTTLSLAEARVRFASYLQQNGYTDLKLGEVMQFTNNFYAEAVYAGSGAGAMELLMRLDGQAVGPEPGPAMMWNTAYGPMGGYAGAGFQHGMMGSGYGHGYGMMGNGSGHGMMRGYGMPGNPATPGGGANGSGYGMMGYHPETATQLDQPLTAEAAQARLQTWLDQNRPGVSATDATAFPGYFTFHTEQNGQITGMVSVQAATGAIWEHVWHGSFVAMDSGA